MSVEFEQGSEYVGDLGWIGCPHCEGPVNAKPVRDEALGAFASRLAELIERGKVAPAELVKDLRILSADLYESTRYDISRSAYPLSMLEGLDPDEPEPDEEEESKEGNA